jgi:hypothetical protein
MEASGQFHPPAAFPRRETAPDTNFIGGWMGPRTGLEVMDKRIFCISELTVVISLDDINRLVFVVETQ